jgi:2-polyprenyl-3-methyl-5-hydroxy-6-metoxy-1,4-benzoquinol methylase
MKCTRCGLLFLHPLPLLTPERLNEIYSQDYAESVYPVSQIRILESALHRQMAIIEKYGNKGRMLNVGAMSGEVRVLKERGWIVQIVEASGYAAERARREWGLDVTVSRIEDFTCTPGSFDFIKLGHVIEHLSDPAATIDRLMSMLRPGGLILIDTDNADGIESRLEAALMGVMRIQPVRRVLEKLAGRKYHMRYGRLTPPVHLYTFTLKSLTSMLEGRGFHVVETFNPPWGDRTWFPIAHASLLLRTFVLIDQLGAKFGRANVIAVLARKS